MPWSQVSGYWQEKRDVVPIMRPPKKTRQMQQEEEVGCMFAKDVLKKNSEEDL